CGPDTENREQPVVRRKAEQRRLATVAQLETDGLDTAPVREIPARDGRDEFARLGADKTGEARPSAVCANRQGGALDAQSAAVRAALDADDAVAVSNDILERPTIAELDAAGDG